MKPTQSMVSRPVLPNRLASRGVRSSCLTCVVTVILTGSSAPSCFAQDKFQTSPVSPGKNETVPPNDTPHYGNLNGVKISVPPKYFASVKVSTLGDSSDCKAPPLPSRYDCPISAIHLDLRRSSFEPISTHQDLLDWASNFLPPSDKTAPEHRWFGVQFRADLYETTKGDLRSLYRSHSASAAKDLGQLTCDSKLGLEHCATKGKDTDSPLSPNEFYFDAATGQTLIECTRLPLPYGEFFTCNQYFSIPEIKAIAEIVNDSDDTNSQWQSMNAAIRSIAISLRAN